VPLGKSEEGKSRKRKAKEIKKKKRKILAVDLSKKRQKAIKRKVGARPAMETFKRWAEGEVEGKRWHSNSSNYAEGRGVSGGVQVVEEGEGSEESGGTGALGPNFDGGSYRIRTVGGLGQDMYFEVRRRRGRRKQMFRQT